MHSTSIVKILSLAMTLVPLANSTPQGGQPCGLGIAPCAEGLTCQPVSDSCTDVNRCSGRCFFDSSSNVNKKKPYTLCGGFRVNPATCEDGHQCCDDPRDAHNCGMACDKPGICVSNDAVRYYPADPCPDGLTYYPYSGKYSFTDALGLCL
ncbi:hypothetical protein GMORB2_1787 [Geosmithia morbida]|uniref:Uncharacterized protein n=1 Tax=Geosmithia morbida TaxID=1094350 RepID=A0A9P4YSY0_9HYPO|nr:uncharacterized protein GMORB2_1787 [Geosmithia morbida]KAF4121947.1 hypothetical protein GMORB2_1787 [Geosmithia morbida]